MKNKLILVILSIIIMAMFTVGCIEGVDLPFDDEDDEPSYWTFELTEGTTEITITQEQIDCGGSTPDEFFVSISTNEINPVVFYDDPSEGWKSWVWGDPWNPLQTIVPGIYRVTVEIDCTLKILKC